MTTSDARTAVTRRDAAHRRVRHVTLGVVVGVVGVTSYGAVALGQAAAQDAAVAPASDQAGSHGTGTGVPASTGVAPGTGQAPVASSGGS